MRDASAVENEDGYRCPERRCESGSYCEGHRCTWTDHGRVRCRNTSYPGTQGVCARHTCVRLGCEKRAASGAIRCEDHMCSFRVLPLSQTDPGDDANAEVQRCYRKRAEPEPFCELHCQVVADMATGGRDEQTDDVEWARLPIPAAWRELGQDSG